MIRDGDDATCADAHASWACGVVPTPPSAACGRLWPECSPTPSSSRRSTGSSTAELVQPVPVHQRPLRTAAPRSRPGDGQLGDHQRRRHGGDLDPSPRAAASMLAASCTSRPCRSGRTRPSPPVYDELNELQRHALPAAVAAAARRRSRRRAGRAPGDLPCTVCPTTARSTGRPRQLRSIGWCEPCSHRSHPAFTWLGIDRIHLDAVSRVDDPPNYEGRIPGRVVRVDRVSGAVDVLTGDGVMRVHRVRLEDGVPDERRGGGVVRADDARPADGRPRRGASFAACHHFVMTKEATGRAWGATMPVVPPGAPRIDRTWPTPSSARSGAGNGTGSPASACVRVATERGGVGHRPRRGAALHDDLYVLACAVDDADRDLGAPAPSRPSAKLTEILRWVLDAARPLRDREPLRTLTPTLNSVMT